VTTVDVDTRAALAAAAEAELARRRLADFIQLVEPTYRRSTHSEVICDHLEAVERGDIDRLMIFMPPRHGKTMHTSQAYAAWTLGRNPRQQIVLASYGAELAEENSIKARAYMRDDRWPFDCRLSEESRARHRWKTDAGGILIAVGIEGGLTGRGADRLIIDDPVQGPEEAASESQREKLWAWYGDVARTRLMPAGKIILCQTRWHDDDLAGRLLNSAGAARWKILSLPAIAEENDPVGRAPGEALWPDRYPVEELPKVPEEISSSSFSALYQQNPVPAGGATFKPEWFEQRYDALPPRMHLYQAVDSAWKDGLANDRSVVATLATDLKDIYVVDIWAGRAKYSDLRRMVIENYGKHKPRMLYVEEAASGYALVDELRRSTGIPIKGISPGRESKEARADSVTNWFEAGRVKFPKSASWMGDLLGEFLRFPHGKHDDIVDAIVLGVTQIRWKINEIKSFERTRRIAGAYMRGELAPFGSSF
jgi:predicted phage terminase large subunit-like protein